MVIAESMTAGLILSLIHNYRIGGNIFDNCMHEKKKKMLTWYQYLPVYQIRQVLIILMYNILISLILHIIKYPAL